MNLKDNRYIFILFVYPIYLLILFYIYMNGYYLSLSHEQFLKIFEFECLVKNDKKTK
jgi:hypothetical protein